jgi:hypothetical protein
MIRKKLTARLIIPCVAGVVFGFLLGGALVFFSYEPVANYFEALNPVVQIETVDVDVPASGEYVVSTPITVSMTVSVKSGYTKRVWVKPMNESVSGGKWSIDGSDEVTGHGTITRRLYFNQADSVEDLQVVSTTRNGGNLLLRKIKINFRVNRSSASEA